MKTVEIGSISTGTLRSEDLLETFADELERLAPMLSTPTRMALAVARGFGTMQLIADARKCCDKLNGDIYEVNESDEIAASEIVNTLSDTLGEFAPPYCYFGTLEGDGADFGFWPDIDSLEENTNDPEDVLKVSDLSEVPNHVMLVNDHGNATLYTVTLKEEWACV